MQTKNNNLTPRQPVVVVVGHIDHGKSSLLEAIREDFKITENESGGITQHIGAYEVEHKGKRITFIDTPGHEAFSAMRQRGAKIADLAILVVDACEGVKAQTKEAIRFAKEASIPIIVAINKIDKPEAVPERVKRELADLDVVVESYGGQVPSCNVSAKAKQGIEELLETIAVVAEVEDLSTDLSKPAEGIVIESRMDTQKGPMATLILNDGILKEGDIVGTNSAVGRIKCLYDFKGKKISQVEPGRPVSCLGFEKPPRVGDCFKVYEDINQAQADLQARKVLCREDMIVAKDDQKLFSFILRVDVLGSLEAIEGILVNLPQDKVILKILKGEVGDINISDIRLAEGGGARIYGFRVGLDETVRDFAEQKKVAIKTFDVIYDLIQEIRKDMTGVLDMETKRVDLGRFKTTVLFKQDKDGQIIGGKVIEGEVVSESQAEIFRGEEKIGGGKIRTVQQEKKNVGRVPKGQECAFLLRTETLVAEGDILVVYREDRQKGIL